MSTLSPVISSAAEPEKPIEWVPDEEFLAAVPFDFAREHLVLGVRNTSQPASLLISTRTVPEIVHNVGVALGQPQQARIMEDDADLAARIEKAYTEADRTDRDETEHLSEVLMSSDDLSDLLSTAGKADVVKLVDAMLFEAVRRGASDLHLQPTRAGCETRLRIDGVLLAGRSIPAVLTPIVVSRIKVMGRMDTAESRVPQDGRATVTIGSVRGDDTRRIDLRISTLPSRHGERVVIRLLDTDCGDRLGRFEALGMPDDTRGEFETCIQRPSGIVLLTGPTGSGKTTTLYATLRWVAQRNTSNDACSLNIMTIEDPVEFELSGGGVLINQAQINTKKGVTFATGLRHILRQDPDVIMVGEIRDEETARIAVQASLTGHLVFSTLHTNDSVSAVTRLIDLGIEPYLVASSLSAVMAQRLVRLSHAICDGEGCDECNHTGFFGRTGLFELLSLDESLRALINAGESTDRLRAVAIERGMRTLRSDGERLILEGRSARAEIERLTLDLNLGQEHSP